MTHRGLSPAAAAAVGRNDCTVALARPRRSVAEGYKREPKFRAERQDTRRLSNLGGFEAMSK